MTACCTTRMHQREFLFKCTFIPPPVNSHCCPRLCWYLFSSALAAGPLDNLVGLLAACRAVQLNHFSVLKLFVPSQLYQNIFYC